MIIRWLMTGTRDWEDERAIEKELKSLVSYFGVLPGSGDLVVVHGACPDGADAMVDHYCEAHGIHREPHPADWDKHGKPAGFIRNQEMVDAGPYAGCTAFWNGEHRSGRVGAGTFDCFVRAVKAGIKVRIIPKVPR